MQSEKPKPVLRLNMAFLPSLGTVQDLNDALVSLLQERAKAHGVSVPREKHASMMLNSVMQSIYNKLGHVVVLIDEYDKPILDNIDDLEKANEIRRLFGLFFSASKVYSEYISFVFITEISKFAKFGLFYPMNNLNNISNDKRYDDILGCSSGG